MRGWYQTGAVLMALLTFPSCGGGRGSVEAYCDSFWTGAVPLHDRWATLSDQGGVAILANLLAAPNDLAAVFDEMKDHAPGEIEADTAAVASALHRFAEVSPDSVSNPLGSMLANAGTAVMTAGSWEEVGRYLDANCPPPPEVR